MLSVVVCTRNRPQLLSRCLEALAAQTGDFEVVVVDQSDAPGLIPGDHCFHHLPHQERGLAAGRNAGVRAASGNVIAFLDDDAVPGFSYIRTLKKTFEEDAELAAAAGRILTLEDGRPYARVHDDRPRPIDRSDWLPFLGGNFAIRRSVINQIGPFDERFGAGRRWASGEETDYFFRMQYRNYRVAYVPALVIHHPKEAVDGAAPELRRKLFAYGRGQGAMMARHLLDFANYRMIATLIWSVTKPSLRTMQYALNLKRDRALLHAAIVLGKCTGFGEYANWRPVSRLQTPPLDTNAEGQKRIILDLRCMRMGRNGPSRFSHEILEALMSLDQNHYYLVLLHPEWKGKINFRPGFEPYFIAHSFKSPLDFLKIYSVARQFKAHIYFSSTFITPLITGTAKRTATLHDLINITLPEYFEGSNKYYAILAKQYLRFQTWLTVRNSDKIVTVAQSSRRHITYYYGIEPRKVSVVYNSAGNRFFAKPISQTTKQRFLFDGPYILGLANFRGYKNIRVLLQAYAKLKKDGAKELLVLFGRYSKELAEREILKSLGPDLAQSVRLLGSLTDDELSEIYTGASVFVFPSLAEGFGIPAIEAMACGTCVVTSNAGSLPEVCGDAAVYVNPRSPSELASVIRSLLESPERRSLLAKKGYQQARKYNWLESAQKLVRMFETL
jgi:glycosyltransferase involved in cell wall biosynthesis/GT2 family glycosyltransferase